MGNNVVMINKLGCSCTFKECSQVVAQKCTLSLQINVHDQLSAELFEPIR